MEDGFLRARMIRLQGIPIEDAGVSRLKNVADLLQSATSPAPGRKRGQSLFRRFGAW
jgi:hypothetical protein